MPAAWAWGSRLPQAFLEAAAPGYLTDTEWDALGEDWLEQALAYTAAPCKGVRGPLTRIRPRPARSRAPGPAPGRRRSAGGHGCSRQGRCTGSRTTSTSTAGAHRTSQIPPAGVLGRSGRATPAPGDQAALGDAAHARGLYRDAAQLHKNAAARGNLQRRFLPQRPSALPPR